MILSELSMKDVVNDEDGIKLGRIVDLDIDIITGKVISAIIDRGFRFSSMNLQFAINRLKEIEAIKEFIESEDFKMLK